MTQDSADIYVNRVTIRFNQLAGMPGSKVIDSYELTVEPRGRIDLDWLNTEVENLFLVDDPDPDTGIRYQRDPFVLTQSRTRYSWGADASAVQFLIETGAYIGQQGGSALIGAGIVKLGQMLKDRGYSVVAGKPEKLMDEEAARFGLRLIENTYDADLTTLTLNAIGTNDQGQYVCTATGREGIYTVTFIVRGADTKLISRNRTVLEQ